MSSRKRAKSKERKLKQQVQAQEPEEQIVSHPVHHTDEIRQWEQHCQWSTCNHGCVIPPRGHPVHNLINIFDEQMSMGNSSITAIKMTFNDHREVWKDNTMRKMAINLLLSIGTSFILRSNIKDAKKTTFAIVLLEHYNGEDTLDSACSKGSRHIGYMPGAGDKDVIRFYYKRIPCLCLKKLYSEIKKSQDRFSTCYHCKQAVKRIDLKTCSRCKCAYYCSKECQISDWPSHKEFCKVICPIHESVKKGRNCKEE